LTLANPQTYHPVIGFAKITFTAISTHLTGYSAQPYIVRSGEMGAFPQGQLSGSYAHLRVQKLAAKIRI